MRVRADPSDLRKEATEHRPLRIIFLDSWHPASHEGSGTAVGIATLEMGLRALGHRIETLRPKRWAGTIAGRVLFNLTLSHRLGSDQPDLVVGFDMDGVLWGISPLRRSPYVVALKGVAADEARFSRSSGERLLLSTLARCEATNAHGADLVFVPSAYSAAVAHREYGLSQGRIRVVPEPIDLSLRVHPVDSQPTPLGRPTILSVARQYPRKDTATLLRASALVREEFPDLHLRIVGGGPELPRLRDLADELRLHGTATFHGALPQDEDVRKAYREAHIFALPSRQEGFGIVFLEAMAAGLPVVAARAGAAPEVVVDGETGILVPPGDPTALAQALLRLLRNPVERARMGEAGRRRVLDYDRERVTLAFLDEVAPILKESYADLDEALR